MSKNNFILNMDHRVLVTFKDNPGGTDKLGFARLDLSQNTNSSARIYSKLTDITYTGK